MLTESLTLALLGAAAGCLLAHAGVKTLPGITPPGVVPSEVEIALNIPVLFFSLVVAVLTALLFGLAPALHAIRRNLVQGLGDSAKGASGASSRGRLRNALVVGQVALSLVLLFGGALLRQSGPLDTRIGTNPSSAAFNNTVLSDVNWLNWRIVSESSGIAWRLRFESRLTSPRAT